MSNKTIIIGIVICVVLICCTAYYKDHYGYDYINYYNEHGIADRCYISKHPQGLLCEVDGNLIEVKQYGKR